MYCNTNYALLAMIVEKVTAHPFPLAMQKIVFKPLGMEHTYIFQQKDSLRAAQSFYYQGSRLYPTDKLEGIYRDWETDRKSTRLNSSHRSLSRMPSSA